MSHLNFYAVIPRIRLSICKIQDVIKFRSRFHLLTNIIFTELCKICAYFFDGQAMVIPKQLYDPRQKRRICHLPMYILRPGSRNTYLDPVTLAQDKRKPSKDSILKLFFQQIDQILSLHWLRTDQITQRSGRKIKPDSLLRIPQLQLGFLYLLCYVFDESFFIHIYLFSFCYAILITVQSQPPKYFPFRRYGISDNGYSRTFALFLSILRPIAFLHC